MKIKVDREADALYLMLGDALAADSEEVSPGIVIDYDKDSKVVGIEILHLSKQSPAVNLSSLVFETVPAV